MPNKLSEMILYVASKSQDDPNFGRTKLNKILFDIDFSAYASFGESVSGEKYVHRQFGIAPYHFLQARDELVGNNRAVEEKRTHFGFPQVALVAIDKPDTSVFTPEQTALMDDVIDNLRPATGSQLSDWTHRMRPWLDTIEGEEIPYETVFVLQKVPLSREDMEWGERKLKELKKAKRVPTKRVSARRVPA